MTHDIIKLMYERDHVLAKPTQSNDSNLWKDYRNLQNKVMCVINEQMNVYFNGIYSLCRNDHPKMWSEIKRLVPSKNRHSHITCDISANDFNNYFANISNKMNSKFQNFDDNFFWKYPKSIHSFRFKKMPNEAIKHIWDLINPIMIYWVWTSFYWDNQSHIFLYHWQMWWINPISRVSLSRSGRTP